MASNPLRLLLNACCLFFFSGAFSQSQTCPVNSNFSMGDLTNWSAYTGTNRDGNGPGSVKQTYSAFSNAPSGTIGNSIINEYQLDNRQGIQVISSQGTDPFGGFNTIPVINGYQYGHSVLLGSTAVSGGGGNGPGGQGGYVRGISYLIDVPVSNIVEPYTMTYAYAMVLQNGTHNSQQQPLISATLTSKDGIITCASPSYFLPTFNNASNGNRGATLDTATAIKNGFSLSSQLSPNESRNGPNGNEFLQDVWTKDWTEVTFDLSAYRGQQVTLTFEADNCVPGGHFAYGYVALRNTCAGLTISGNAVACTNSTLTYSIPALADGTYQWLVPADWTVISGINENILVVKPGVTGGAVIAQEVNGCADLRDTLDVITKSPTIAGGLKGDNTVCSGTNNSLLVLNDYSGDVLKWLASTDGFSWQELPVSTPAYTAQNLTATTTYRALVQNGAACDVDTSAAAIVTVDPKSDGGRISPSQSDICIGQNTGALLRLSGSTGDIINWQSTQDNINWVSFNPAYTNPVYNIGGIGLPTRYRTIVKSGVCPPDTSSIANVNIVSVPFPKTNISPADTTICYGSAAELNATILTGTSYTWSNAGTLRNQGNGNVPSTPYSIRAIASPPRSTKYILRTENAGCPNPLRDTFSVAVQEPVVVNAGNDTSVVFNQPLQMKARVSGTSGDDMYKWSPSFGLSNPVIADPLAVLGINTGSIRYSVQVTSEKGCTGSDDVIVKVFKTAPDIFVPNAFTPGNTTNRVFRPVPVGIASLRYFRIYSRWGQLVFSTSTIGDGWNGIHNGKDQAGNSFVWMVEGTTYDGRVVSKKGTMVLIR